MAKAVRAIPRRAIQKGDLARLERGKLAELLAEQVLALPYHRQKE